MDDESLDREIEEARRGKVEAEDRLLREVVAKGEDDPESALLAIIAMRLGRIEQAIEKRGRSLS